MPMNTAAIQQGGRPQEPQRPQGFQSEQPKVVITEQQQPEMRSVDPERYVEFVSEVTSAESTDFASLLKRMTQLEVDGANVPKLLTAAAGLCAESGEFTEVVKKITFQGKPYNEENIFHMKRELGDSLWYVAQACMALDTGFDELMEMNVDKLKARYPGGEFDVHYSENRKEGDL
jgi:NTP pyrophosphatase (non-canonical NTP hydrolase)